MHPTAYLDLFAQNNVASKNSGTETWSLLFFDEKILRFIETSRSVGRHGRNLSPIFTPSCPAVEYYVKAIWVEVFYQTR